MKMIKKGVEMLLKRQASVFSTEDNVTALKIESMIIIHNRTKSICQYFVINFFP